MPVLTVSKYRVGTNRSRSNAGAHARFLQLFGSSDSGPVKQAIIYFWPEQPVDTVGYVAGDLVVGLLHERDFPAMYDIVRNEKPVRLTFAQSSNPAEIRLAHIGLGTNEEPVGEGPFDQA